MKTYLYVPEDLEVSDFFAQAKESNINQIIHGESDIIREHLNATDSPCIINIPEFQGFWMEKFVFEESEKVPVVVVDEWVKSDSYESIILVIHRMDTDDPLVMHFVKEVPMAYDTMYTFYELIDIEKYGEYYLEVFACYPDGSKKILDARELIVYKKNEEEEAHFDFGL